MGTNYKINGKHVGKTSGRAGKTVAFMWAMPPREFLTLVADHAHDIQKCRSCGIPVGPLNDYCQDCMGGGSCRNANPECEICEAWKAIIEADSEEFDNIGRDFS